MSTSNAHKVEKALVITVLVIAIGGTITWATGKLLLPLGIPAIIGFFWGLYSVYKPDKAEKQADRIANLPSVQLVKLIATFAALASVIWATFSYLADADRRQTQRVYQAWQVVNTSAGRPGVGARVRALEGLLRDGQSLAGADVSRADLSGIMLDSADISRGGFGSAHLDSAVLTNATAHQTDFSRSTFTYAKLDSLTAVLADFRGVQASLVSLRHANLSKVNFNRAPVLRSALTREMYDTLLKSFNNILAYDTVQTLGDAIDAFQARVKANAIAIPTQPHQIRAELINSNLHGTNLTGASLQDANFSFSNLHSANLSGADLTGTVLAFADLRHADLEHVKGWEDVGSFVGANIGGIRNAPDGFAARARKHGAVELSDSLWNAFRREAALGRVVADTHIPPPRIRYDSVLINCEPLRRRGVTLLAEESELCVAEPSNRVPQLLRAHRIP